VDALRGSPTRRVVGQRPVEAKTSNRTLLTERTDRTMATYALALLLLAKHSTASCAGNCAAPLNVTCGSVLVVGDSTTAEYAQVELRVLLEDLGVGPIYVADPESSGPCGSSFGLASCIAPYLAHKWSVIVLGWAHRDIKANVYGVVTVDEYRNHLWQTYASLITSLAPGGSFVFMTSVPVGASYDKRDNADAVQLNEEALQLLEGEDIVIVDLYERIVAACRRDPGLACYPETCDCERFQSDGVHGTAEGRWLKALLVAEAIVTLYRPTGESTDCAPLVTEATVYDDKPGPADLVLGNRLVSALAVIGFLCLVNAGLVVLVCRRKAVVAPTD